MDTLWLDTPSKLHDELKAMKNRHALFGMALETTEMNGNASWYNRGRLSF